MCLTCLILTRVHFVTDLGSASNDRHLIFFLFDWLNWRNIFDHLVYIVRRYYEQLFGGSVF